jgi:hypothetical protein
MKKSLTPPVVFVKLVSTPPNFNLVPSGAQKENHAGIGAPFCTPSDHESAFEVSPLRSA